MRLSLKSGPSQNLVTSCHKQNHQTENTSFFSFKEKKIHIMWICPCTLTYWCTKPSTKHKLTKHAFSNNWLISQIIELMYKFPYLLHLSVSNITLLSTSCFMQHAPYFEFAKTWILHPPLKWPYKLILSVFSLYKHQRTIMHDGESLALSLVNILNKGKR